jgi:hypothetical protein
MGHDLFPDFSSSNAERLEDGDCAFQPFSKMADW